MLTKETFIKSNKKRRLSIAQKLGKTVEELFKELTGKTLKEFVREKPAFTGEKPNIHIVQILDASGSMQGAKLNSAIRGINEEIKELQREKDINYFLTLVHFSGKEDIKTKYHKTPIQEIFTVFNTNSRGITALYDAIGRTIYPLILDNVIGSKEKVLVKIFTDRQNTVPMLSIKAA